MPSSSKEQEVLERQRQLAATIKQQKLKADQAASVAAAAKNEKNNKKKQPTAAAAAAPTLKRPSSHKNSTSLKRPSTARPVPAPAPAHKRPASASAVLAAARNKAQSENKDKTTSNTTTSSSSNISAKENTAASSTAAAAAASIPRQTKGGQPSAFSSLVNKSAATSSSAAETDDYQSTSLPSIEPDDFWKHLREWDFVHQVHTQLEQQKNPNADLVPEQKPKSLPDVFLNSRHYVAAWAPLSLAETRAQLLSEWLGDVGSGRIQKAGVMVQAVTTDNRGPSRRHNNNNNNNYMNFSRLEPEDSVCLKLNTTRGDDNNNNNNNNNNSMSFITNDIVLLVPPSHKDLFVGLLNGKYKATADEYASNNPFKKWGIVVGHAKCTRKTPNDLIVEVSKRKWASVPSSTTTTTTNNNNNTNNKQQATTMWLWKLGSNVTALREFTALCNMDKLPLKRFLLGQHLLDHPQQQKNNNKDNKKAIMEKPTLNKNKSDLLEQMGGSQALGKGFTAYARQKFNPSQLMAIAASAHEYGEGGFTLIKGPPGTGKTTTLVAVLNSLHIRQYNKYYDQVRQIAAERKNRQFALELARKSKPRLLVCAPSNAAVDNIILKIIDDGFVDGAGKRYNPSMIRIGVGQSGAVKRAVSLEQKVDAIFTEYQDVSALDGTINQHKLNLQNLNMEITKCRRRVHAIENASPWPLSKDWEIRIDEETFDQDPMGGRCYFVNHREQTTTFEVPPPPEPGEHQFSATAMPEYRALMSSIVKLVEQCFTIKTQLERCTIVKGSIDAGANHIQVRQSLEQHVLNTVHIVMTTLGSAGGRALEGIDKFEVVVVDEAAQSVEPATLSALQLGSRHCVLVGDPQQLPATIFNVSGKTTKYDRSLFQRLEEAHQPVYMLEEQYRMHPKISHFPRHIFYGGNLRDGPNVLQEGYGNPLRQVVAQKVPLLQPFTVLDLDSKEERGGTSLANSSEAHLAVHLYNSLNELSGGLLRQSKVAIITPYAQQTKLLHRTFENALGPRYESMVEVNTVDAYQGREANVVIFSAVRAAGSHGIGFLSDVRRMNVALTRAKHFLFVVARCKSIVVNPYWKDLVEHARENHAVLRVPVQKQGNNKQPPQFGHLQEWQLEDAARPYTVGMPSLPHAVADSSRNASAKPPEDPRRKKLNDTNNDNKKPLIDPRRKNQKVETDGNNTAGKAPSDPRRKYVPTEPTNGHDETNVGRPVKKPRGRDPRKPPPTHQHGGSNNSKPKPVRNNGRGYAVHPVAPPPPPPPPPREDPAAAGHVPPPPPPPPPLPPPPPPPPKDPRKANKSVAPPTSKPPGDPRKR